MSGVLKERTGYLQMHMTNWKIQIDPREVYYLKFILEGYDNLATMSTVDRQQGIVELYIPSGNEDLVRELLVAIKTEIGLKTENRIQNTEVRSQSLRTPDVSNVSGG